MVFIFMLHFFDNRKYVDTYQDLQTIFSFHYSWYFGCSSVVTNFTLHHPYLCRQFVFFFFLTNYYGFVLSLSHAHNNNNNNQTINIDLDISQKYFCNVCCKGSRWFQDITSSANKMLVYTRNPRLHMYNNVATNNVKSCFTIGKLLFL